ncbi:MAG: glycosyltransferase [Clostridia bacterium]|nr:glycosyltransferase [Clostridia bacterium]
MKKRLLFVMESMGSGGGERSLLTLLQLTDYDKYSVDLLLFNPSGLFMNMIPKQVNIISLGKGYERFVQPFGASIKAYLLRGDFKGVYNRFLYSKTVNGKYGSTLYRDQLAWKYMRAALTADLPEYDAAIGYLEGKPNFFVADCVRAKIKIAYIHSDYRKLEMDKAFDEKIFEKMDYIVGVSDKCADILREEFPEFKEKIRAVENITSPKVLHKMAEEKAAEYENIESTILLTVGRMAPPKGYDIAVDAASILAENGVDFKWFAIGKGELQAEIEQKIKEKNLEDKFILLGERANPYPYIAGCDIYVQPSYYEGKSIAIDEAKCFAKPIVATRFTTVLDQLADGETALLAEIDAKSVAEKIMQLMAEEKLCEHLSENLKKEKLGNEEEINKFYEMLR